MRKASYLRCARACPPIFFQSNRFFSSSSLLRAKSLIIAEHNEEVLSSNNLATATAAAKLGTEIHLLIAGASVEKLAAEAAKINSISKVFYVNQEYYKHGIPENLAPLIQSLQQQEQYTHLLAAASSFGKNLMPRVAALLDVAPIADVIEIDGENSFKRPMYAGNVIAKIVSDDKVKVITVRTTAFAKAKVLPTAGAGAPAALALTPVIEPGRARWVSDELQKTARPELTSAKTVVSGGRALKSKENFKIIEELADVLGGAVGASRAAVDAGYAPNDWQVGQTGKVVAPELYIAAGISGQIQHLAGMKDSKVIVAINTAADAPIFQVADYGVVMDLFTAVPELTNKIKAAKAKK